MKKILAYLLLLIPALVFGQNTHVLEAGTQPLLPQFRYKAVTPDSLNHLWLFNPTTAKYNRIYTATEIGGLSLYLDPITLQGPGTDTLHPIKVKSDHAVSLINNFVLARSDSGYFVTVPIRYDQTGQRVVFASVIPQTNIAPTSGNDLVNLTYLNSVLPSGYTANNGLTLSGSNIKLGGNLVNSTSIGLNGNQFTVGGGNALFQMNPDVGFGGSAYLNVNGGTYSQTVYVDDSFSEIGSVNSGARTSLQVYPTGIFLRDDFNSGFARYYSNYASTFSGNPRAIADVGFNDARYLLTGAAVTSVSAGYGMNFTTITNSGPVKADSTVLQTIANFFPKGDTRYAKITALPTGATPTATITFTATPGSATSFTRSDGAPKADSTVIRSVANSYSLAGMQTKLNNYVLKTYSLANGYGINSIGDFTAGRAVSADTSALAPKAYVNNFLTKASAATTYAPITGSGNYINNGTSPQTANFNITGNGTTRTSQTGTQITSWTAATFNYQAFGLGKWSLKETNSAFSRPVAWDRRDTIAFTTLPSSLMDAHGDDVNLYMTSYNTNTRGYASEITLRATSNNATDTLLRGVAQYLQNNKSGSSVVNQFDNLRLTTQVSGGTVQFAYGVNAQQPVLSGGGTIGDYRAFYVAAPPVSGVTTYRGIYSDAPLNLFRGVQILNQGTSEVPLTINTVSGQAVDVMTVQINSVDAFRIGSTGNVGIAAAPGTATALNVMNNITGGISATEALFGGTIQSGVTSRGVYNSVNAVTAAATFTLVDLIHYRSNQGTFGAGSTVTNQYGFRTENTLTGATNNYSFYANIASGTNRWNFFANGTANNAFAGSSSFGKVTAPGFVVDISGTLGASGAVTFSNYTTAGILHNAVTTGLLSSSLIVNADITNSTIDLTTKVTGTLPVANGGSGVATITGLIKGNGTSPFSAAAAGTDYQAPITLTTTGSGAATFISNVLNIPTPTIPTGANPSQTVGLSAVNGSSPNFMRADAAPALDQSIAPLWTGLHTWTKSSIGTGVGTGLGNVLILAKNPTAAAVGAQQNSPYSGWEAQVWNTTVTAASNPVDVLVRAEGIQGTTPTANLVFYTAVNGGNPIANGIIIGGTGRVSAPAFTVSTAPPTSAGTYTFLTRNTSTGLFESVASTAYALSRPAATRSSAGTLTLAYSNDYVFTGTTATYTLPAIAAGSNSGDYRIYIKNAGSGNITVNSASGSTIYDTSLVSTITIAAGSSVTLTPDGTQFNK